jgi:hypothetical protein
VQCELLIAAGVAFTVTVTAVLALSHHLSFDLHSVPVKTAVPAYYYSRCWCIIPFDVAVPIGTKVLTLLSSTEQRVCAGCIGAPLVGIVLLP